jgi:HEAT repeat protein
MRLIPIAVFLITFLGCSRSPIANTGERVNYWVQVLQEPEAKRRQEAAFKLGNLGPTDPAKVLPALIAALKDADAEVRCAAILALVKCRPEARRAISELAEVQKNDDDARVRDYAGQAVATLQQQP